MTGGRKWGVGMGARGKWRGEKLMGRWCLPSPFPSDSHLIELLSKMRRIMMFHIRLLIVTSLLTFVGTILAAEEPTTAPVKVVDGIVQPKRPVADAIADAM